MESIINQFQSLGTTISHHIVCEKTQTEIARKTLEKLANEYQKGHDRFSRFSPESELSYFNTQLGYYHPASTDFIEVVKHCLHYNRETQGLFDPRVIGVLEQRGYDQDFFTTDFSRQEIRQDQDIVSHQKPLEQELLFQGKQVCFQARMDFSGIVKGYITDRMTQRLLDQGWNDFIVDSGGDIRVHGHNQQEQPWRIGIEGVKDNQLLVNLQDGSIATSGISRRKWEFQGKRFHHLIHPNRPDVSDFSIRTVTALFPTCTDADVWAKTYFLKGYPQAIISANQNGHSIIVIRYDGTIWVSEKMKQFIA